MRKLQLLPAFIALLMTAACGQQRSAQLDQEFSTGILGGTPVSETEDYAKSTVGIGADLQGVICTGVLVSKNLVMTAAHCTGTTFRPNQLAIYFGLDLKAPLIERRVLGGKVTTAWPALTNDQTTNWGDIALLKFEGEAPQGYVPARLLGSSEPLKNGMDVTLAGYGATSMSPETYPDKLLKATVKLSNANYSETEILFDFIDGKGACHGDSGGPAFTTINGKLFVIGITSRSPTVEGGYTCLEGAIYSSVPGHIEFLKKAARYLNSKDFVPNERIPQP